MIAAVTETFLIHMFYIDGIVLKQEIIHLHTHYNACCFGM